MNSPTKTVDSAKTVTLSQPQSGEAVPAQHHESPTHVQEVDDGNQENSEEPKFKQQPDSDCDVKLEQDQPEETQSTTKISELDPRDYCPECGICTKEFYNEALNEHEYQHLKPQITQLCLDIGYPAPIDIKRMSKGSYNKCFELFFPADFIHERGVLRLPYFVDEDGIKGEIKDRVCLLKWLEQYEFLNVPRTLAYDATQDNAIKREWVLCTRIEGERLDEVFYDLSLKDRLHLTTQVAEMALKIQDIKFDEPGGFRAAEGMADTCLVNEDISKDILMGVLWYDKTREERHEYFKEPLHGYGVSAKRAC